MKHSPSRTITRRAILGGFAGGIVCAALPSMAAASYPDRAIRIVVPFPPGGETDNFCRMVADQLAQVLGQPTVVENRPGANGMLACRQMVRADPDGYTVLFGTAGTHALNLTVYKNPGYDPLRDFESFALIGSVPIIVYANPEMPKDPQDLLALLKAHPGEYRYGGVYYGTAHLAMEKIQRVAGLRLEQIPYKGSQQAMLETAAGITSLTTGSIGSGLPFVESGKLQSVAVMAKDRLEIAHDIPTLEELGIRDCEASTWHVFSVPKGTPQPIVQKLNTAIGQVMADPAINAKAVAHGLVPTSGSTPESTTAYIRSEITHWADIFKMMGAAPV